MPHLDTIFDLYDFNESQKTGLLEALSLVGCNVEEFATAEMTLDALNESLQNSFLRPVGSERDHLSDKFKDEALRAKLLPLLSPFIDEMNSGNNIAVKLLLGASEEGVRERLDILVELTQKGYLTQVIYPLGGARELWAVREPSTIKLVAQELALVKKINLNDAITEVGNKISEFFITAIEMKNNREAYTDKEFTVETNKAHANLIEYFTKVVGITWPTEADMMEGLIAEYKLKLPNIEFKPVVNVSKKLNQAGQWVRPDTLDTYNKMWEMYGDAISMQALNDGKVEMSIITTQPFGYYQEQQAKTAFYGKQIEVKTVAKAASATVNFAIVFDSFARTIFSGRVIALEKLRYTYTEVEKPSSFADRCLVSTNNQLCR
ncbi:MAG: hypothetical protein AABY27_04780 [Pseudomonadota bacterium]